MHLSESGNLENIIFFYKLTRCILFHSQHFVSFFLFFKIMNTKKAIYTFAFDSSGICFETELIPEIGNIFSYWGYKWIVTNINEENNNYIVDVEKYFKS